MVEVVRSTRAPLAVVAGGVAGAAWLLAQDPHEPGHLFPRCPFRVMTGLQCPSCGSTRMAYDLLHLDVAAAWRDNALLLLVTPLALWLLVRWVIAGLRGRRVDLPLGRRSGLVVLGTAIAWGVARNLS